MVTATDIDLQTEVFCAQEHGATVVIFCLICLHTLSSISILSLLKSLQQLDIVFKVKPKSIHILASLLPQNFPILFKLVSLLFFKHLFTLPHLFIVFLCMTFLLPILLCLLKSYLSCKTSSRNELTLCFSLL